MGISVFGQTSEIRSYKEWETIAYCTYKSYHPSLYAQADNNWELLIALRTPMTLKELKASGIPFNNSQIILLLIGGLLESKNNVVHTVMPIFSEEQTKSIRTLSKTIAQSAYTDTEKEWVELMKELKTRNLAKNAYSLIFSYVLDGKIWKRQLPSQDSIANHATWNGAFWALYNKRPNSLSYGTNGINKMFYQTWSDSLSYWLGNKTILEFMEEYKQNKKIVSKDLLDKTEKWGLTDDKGNVVIPVINEKGDDTFVQISDEIVAKLASCAGQYSHAFMEKFQLSNENLAKVILYHEVMWDMMDILVNKKIITQPDILKGSNHVKQRDFGQIVYIVKCQ